jgi:hypothetical protein
MDINIKDNCIYLNISEKRHIEFSNDVILILESLGITLVYGKLQHLLKEIEDYNEYLYKKYNMFEYIIYSPKSNNNPNGEITVRHSLRVEFSDEVQSNAFLLQEFEKLKNTKQIIYESY